MLQVPKERRLLEKEVPGMISVGCNEEDCQPSGSQEGKAYVKCQILVQ